MNCLHLNRCQPLTGDDYALLRQNPDRGFRLEAYLRLGSGSAVFHPGFLAGAYLEKQLVFYREEDCKLVQLYVYLSEYLDRPLDAHAFSQLETYLETLRQKRLRALLRFAYEEEADRKNGPVTAQILAHAGQISVWMEQHEALVYETVAALQAGFNGAWGEWHTAKHHHSGKKLMEAICQMAPAQLPIQVRTLPIWEKAPHQEQGRIGFHDEYLVGAHFKWNSDRGRFWNRRERTFRALSRLRFNDGEMPWGKDTVYQNGRIDGLQMLACCANHSLSTLSISHNYREGGGSFNMLRWQGEALAPEQLDFYQCPYHPAYFTNHAGQPIRRTIFDYLCDHLGYQIHLLDCGAHRDIKNENFTHEICFTLLNKGFALPYTLSRLTVSISNREGKVVDYEASYLPEQLASGEKASFIVPVRAEMGSKIGIRLCHPSAPAFSARFANAIPFEDGCNMVGSL